MDVPRLPPRPGLEPGPARVVEPDAPADAQAGVEQALDLDALVVGLGRADEPGSGGKHHGLAGEAAAGGHHLHLALLEAPRRAGAPRGIAHVGAGHAVHDLAPGELLAGEERDVAGFDPLGGKGLHAVEPAASEVLTSA